MRERLLRGRAQRGVHCKQGLQEGERARVRLWHAPSQAGALGAQDLVAPLAASAPLSFRGVKNGLVLPCVRYECARCTCIKSCRNNTAHPLNKAEYCQDLGRATGP